MEMSRERYPTRKVRVREESSWNIPSMIVTEFRILSKIFNGFHAKNILRVTSESILIRHDVSDETGSEVSKSLKVPRSWCTVRAMTYGFCFGRGRWTLESAVAYVLCLLISLVCVLGLCVTVLLYLRYFVLFHPIHSSRPQRCEKDTFRSIIYKR